MTLPPINHASRPPPSTGQSDNSDLPYPILSTNHLPSLDASTTHSLTTCSGSAQRTHQASIDPELELPTSGKDSYSGESLNSHVESNGNEATNQLNTCKAHFNDGSRKPTLNSATPQTKRILNVAQKLYKAEILAQHPFPDHALVNLKSCIARQCWEKALAEVGPNDDGTSILFDERVETVVCGSLPLCFKFR